MKALVVALLSSGLLGCTADVSAQAVCTTSFAFVINGQPAMKNVITTISRRGEAVHHDSRHSFTLELPCGAGYEISGDGFRTRYFDAGSNVVVTLEGSL